MSITLRFVWVFAVLCMFLVAGDQLLAQGGQGRGFRYRGGRGASQDQDSRPGFGRGPGGQRGRGAGNAFSQDHDIFHFLLQNHKQIKRKVKQLENGVDTLTESDDPQIAAKIQEHVAAMYKRVEEGIPIHMRDPLFAAVFQNADKIKMEFENTKHGVRVVETSEDPYVAKLIQEHAKVVNQFVKKGHQEARLNHAVPARDGDAAETEAATGHGRGRWGRAGAGPPNAGACPNQCPGAADDSGNSAGKPCPGKGQGAAGCPAGCQGRCPHGSACPHAADEKKACDQQGQCPAVQEKDA
jgi:hypothetical protein